MANQWGSIHLGYPFSPSPETSEGPYQLQISPWICLGLLGKDFFFLLHVYWSQKHFLIKVLHGSGWYGSVDWVLACEPKGRWFDSQSGHMPGLWARSPVGGMQEATTHGCFSPSLSLSLPFSIKEELNKIVFKNYDVFHSDYTNVQSHQ